MVFQYLEAFTAIFIFSFVPVAIKFTDANPYSIGIFRLFIASFAVLWWWRKKILLNQFKTYQIWRLVLIGAIFFCHWLTYFFAIKIGGAQACVLGMSTYGIQLIIYGSIFLGYHLRLKNYLALIVVLIGIYLLLPEFNLTNQFSKGLMLGLISAAFYSILPILHQRFNQYFDYEIRIFSQFFFCLIGFSFFYPETNWNLVTKDWFTLLFLAIFGTLIAHSLWAKSTSRLPTYISGIIYYAITPSALILSHLIFNESLNLKQIVGATLIVSAAIFNIWSSHANRSTT
jgi:drug/metabolite transporter (DMT)-like permease